MANELDPVPLTEPARGPVGELLSPLCFPPGVEAREPVDWDGDNSRDDLLPDRASIEVSFSSLK